MSPKMAQMGVYSLISAILLLTDAESLVAQLGSPRYAEREAATTALAKLGPQAIPILREARQDQDPEVKSRAELLIDTIERDMLTQPSPIEIKAGKTTLNQIVETIARTQKVSVSLQDTRSKGAQTVPMASGESLTFWQVMDLFGLMPQLEASRTFGFRTPPQPSSIRLVKRVGPMMPSVDDGPFRIIAQPAMLVLDAMPFDAGFRQPRQGRFPDANREQDLVIPLEVVGEPRLTVRANGQVQILEAIDDRDRLVPVSPRNAMETTLSGFRDRSAPFLVAQVRLKPDGSKLKSLKRLKGIIPVEVEARQNEPTIIPLNPSIAEFRTIPCGETSILVHSLKPSPDGSGDHLLEVSIRQEALKLTGRIGRGPNRRLQELLPDSDPIWQNLEVVDASGQPFTISEQQSVGPLAVDGEVRKLVTIKRRDAGSSPPSELRFYGQIQTTMDLAFDFTDLPTP